MYEHLQEEEIPKETTEKRTRLWNNRDGKGSRRTTMSLFRNMEKRQLVEVAERMDARIQELWKQVKSQQSGQQENTSRNILTQEKAMTSRQRDRLIQEKEQEIKRLIAEIIVKGISLS